MDAATSGSGKTSGGSDDQNVTTEPKGQQEDNDVTGEKYGNAHLHVFFENIVSMCHVRG